MNHTAAAEGGRLGMECLVPLGHNLPARLHFALLFFDNNFVRQQQGALSMPVCEHYRQLRRFHCLLCIVLMQWHALARAQENPTRLHVVIDESLGQRAVGEVDLATTSSAHSVIEAARFRDSFVSLQQVLEQEIGVQTRSTGGEGSLSMVVLRGASSEQVMVYLDGVPLNDAAGGAVDLGLIPLDQVERIEVYRGSTPLQLGRPSIGGAVNIVTRRQMDGVAQNQVSATLASFDTGKLSLSAGASGQHDTTLFSAAWLQARNDFSYVNDNGTVFNPDDDSVQRRQNDGVRQLSALASWKHRFSSTADSELRFDGVRRDKQIASLTNSADVQTFLDTRQLNALVQFNLRQIGRHHADMAVKLSGSYKNELFDDTLAQLGFINQRSTSITRKAGVQLFGEIPLAHSRWKLLSGIARESYDSNNSLAPVQTDTSVRRQGELSVEHQAYFDDDRLLINTVLRWQQIDDSIATQTDAFANTVPGFRKRYRLLNLQLGIKYRFNQHSYFHVNAGQYHRAPSLVELFGGSGLLRGNPTLLQESALNTDAGFSYRWFRPYHWLHDAELYAGVFANDIDDLIVYLYNGQGIGVPENISNAEVRGVEISFKLKPVQHHALQGELSLTDSINRSPLTSFNGRQLPGFYRTSLNLRYHWTLGYWTLGVEADIKRQMFYDRSNLLPGDDVNLINLSLQYRHRNTSLTLQLRNLRDENIEYFRGRPTPGRSLALTLSQEF